MFASLRALEGRGGLRDPSSSNVGGAYCRCGVRKKEWEIRGLAKRSHRGRAGARKTQPGSEHRPVRFGRHRSHRVRGGGRPRRGPAVRARRPGAHDRHQAGDRGPQAGAAAPAAAPHGPTDPPGASAPGCALVTHEGVSARPRLAGGFPSTAQPAVNNQPRRPCARTRPRAGS
jgi:hypothetical protein